MLMAVNVSAIRLWVSLVFPRSGSPRGGRAGLARRAVALALGVLETWSTPSLAQSEQALAARDPASAQCQPAALSGRTPLPPADIAALFGEFQCRLAAGQYSAALSALESTCSSSGDPACLFNRALVHHAQLRVPDAAEPEHCALSRRNYSGYVDASPYTPAAQQARRALLELREICGAYQIDPTPTRASEPDVIAARVEGAAPSPDEVAPERESIQSAPRLPVRRSSEPEGPSRRTTTWIFLGAGAASALAAVFTGIHMRRAYDDLRALEVSPEATQVPPEAEFQVYRTRGSQVLDERLTRYQTLTWGLGASAAVLLGIGVGSYILDSAPAPSLAVSLSPGFGSLGYRGRF